MDNLDIDSNSFDAQRYVTEFLKKNTLQDLIRKNNTI